MLGFPLDAAWAGGSPKFPIDRPIRSPRKPAYLVGEQRRARENANCDGDGKTPFRRLPTLANRVQLAIKKYPPKPVALRFFRYVAEKTGPLDIFRSTGQRLFSSQPSSSDSLGNTLISGRLSVAILTISCSMKIDIIEIFLRQFRGNASSCQIRGCHPPRLKEVDWSTNCGGGGKGFCFDGTEGSPDAAPASRLQGSSPGRHRVPNYAFSEPILTSTSTSHRAGRATTAAAR